MEILKFTGNPLVRQTTEAHLITKQSQKGIALNRKGEWGQNLAPKLISEGQEPPPLNLVSSNLWVKIIW